MISKKPKGARRHVRIQGADLFLGDCGVIVPQLGRVDAVITDPPYGERTHQRAKTNKKGAADKKLVTFDSITGDQLCGYVRQWLDAADGWCIATVDLHHAPLLYPMREFVRLGAWVKKNPAPQMSGDRPAQGFEKIVILHAGKRRKRWARKGKPATWHHSVCTRAQVPTQKPLALLQDLVSDFTLPGETVLDGFMGGGTTGEACLRAGRRFIGIERDPVRFQVTVDRLRAVAREIAKTTQKENGHG